MPRGQVILLRIGQIAEANEVSIPKLNYYIGLGLLRPSKRSAGGQRLFDPDEIASRLDQIASLQKAGKSLEEIKAVMNRNRG